MSYTITVKYAHGFERTYTTQTIEHAIARLEIESAKLEMVSVTLLVVRD